MRDLLHDLRYGLSTLVRKPAFAIVALSALALGIGANAAIFSAVNALLLRPLPYAHAERIVRLHDEKPPELVDFPVSPGNFTYWQRNTRSFEHVGAVFSWPLVLTGGERPEQLDAARMSASMFPLLSTSPVLGRAFRADEEERGRDQVIILSDALWRSRFGASRTVLGQTITLTDKPYTIIGVMPPSFRFPSESTQAWVPLGFTPRDRARHGSHHLTVLGRLKPASTIRQAQAEMDTLARRLAVQNPETNAGWRVDVVNWQDDLVGSMRTPLLILAAAVSFVLLIACVNVTNLLLARGASRTKEVAVRMALGASRIRIIRQLLTESVLLSLTGGVLGVAVAFFGVRALTALAPATLLAAQNVSIDARVLAFTFAVSMLAGIACGLAPAIQLTRSDVNSGLEESARGATAGRGRQRLQKTLVVLEVCLSLLLLIGAALLIRSFTRVREVNAGIDPRNVLTMNVALPKTRYPDDAQRARYFQRAIEEVQSVPGVQSAAAVVPLPFADSMNYGFAFEGQPSLPPDQWPVANHYLVSPRYFEVLRVPLLRGRLFDDRDREGAPRVAIINATMARTYFANESPIGKRIFITNGSEVWREIVGVVADVKQSGLDAEPSPQMYEPYLQEPFFTMSIAVRTESAPAMMSDAVVRRLMAVDKDQPVTNIRTMESLVAESLTRRRFSMTLLALFAAVALILAATGIYGVMSFAVSQRTQEIGIRMCLGAQTADVFRLIVGEGAKLAGAGVTIGLAAALALMPAMRSLLFGVSATDVPTFAGVAALVTAVALLASYIPARRVTKTDLVVSLRAE
jgi:putative ABC transport system permease protein